MPLFILPFTVVRIKKKISSFRRCEIRHGTINKNVSTYLSSVLVSISLLQAHFKLNSGKNPVFEIYSLVVSLSFFVK